MKKMKLSGSTKTKTIVGIDYSLTSPAICVDNGNLMFFYLTNKKKWTGQMSEDIIGYEHKSGLTLYKDLKIFQILCLILSVKHIHNFH